MNIFSKQAYRKPFFSLLMVLLLGLSIALSCIGYGAWSSAQKQKNTVSTEYTTIAIPYQQNFYELYPKEELKDGEGTLASKMVADEIAAIQQKTIKADWAAQEAPQLKGIDRRLLLSAYIPGSKSLSSSRLDPAEYNGRWDQECYNTAVLAVRCESVTDTTRPGDWNLSYIAYCSVEEVVSLSDAYDCFPAPDTINVSSCFYEKDGSIPFEVGKTYLVFGQYDDYSVERTKDGYKQNTSGGRLLKPFPESNGETDNRETGERDGTIYYYTSEGQLPWVCEYEGTVEEFLSSADATVWNEVILPMCRINQESAAVILTDNIQSMYAFNTGEKSLLSGRFFTDEEYEAGADVCVISAAYAEVNSLQLGDTLTLDLYDSGYAMGSDGAMKIAFSGYAPGAYYQRNCMTPEDSIGVCKEYKIVGIYTGTRLGYGTYHFNADTIFIPQASVPVEEIYGEDLQYKSVGSAFLSTFILENGTEEAFEAYMEEQGFGGMFMYFNQEFTSMEESLDALETNAMRLMLVGSGAFILVCVLFLFLNFRRMNPVIRGARLLGRGSGVVFREVVTVLLLLGLFSIALGAGMSVVLFDTIMEKVLSGTLAFDVSAVLIVSAAAFVCYALASVLSTAIAVRKNLMKRK